METVLSGKTRKIIDESPSASGVTTKEFHLESSAVMVSLYVSAASGTLDVVVKTYEPGKSDQPKTIAIFPQQSGATSAVLLTTIVPALDRVEVVATYSASCTYSVSARGMSILDQIDVTATDLDIRDLAFATDSVDVSGSSVSITPTTNNAIEVKQTTVTTNATKIDMPEEATNFVVYHNEPGETAWIGQDEDITVGGTDVCPLQNGDTLTLELSTGDDNGLYAIVASGTITIYVIGKVTI